MAATPTPPAPLRDRGTARSQADPTSQNSGHPCGAFTLAPAGGTPDLHHPVSPAPGQARRGV